MDSTFKVPCDAIAIDRVGAGILSKDGVQTGKHIGCSDCDQGEDSLRC